MDMFKNTNTALLKLGHIKNTKCHVFENTNGVVIYVCSTREPLNYLLFSFALKLLTVRTLIISSRLLICSFT